jgi:hypothetical protein
LPFTFAACGGGSSSDDCTPSGGSNTGKYVTNSVTVPIQKSDYSIDLNGDGRPDNQLGNIIGALSGQGLNVQDGVTQAINNGTLIILATEKSGDPAFQMDSCAGVNLQLGSLPAGTMMPDYTGSGSFTASGNNSDTFAGPISGGKFSSSSPVTTKMPVSVSLALPLIAGATPVQMNIIGAHLSFTRDASGKLNGGQLQGAIKNSDVQGKIIPNVAMLLTTKVQEIGTPKETPADGQIEMIFDTGGCTNPDGSMAVKGDKIISPCEVATSGLIQNVLAPDVQMFDAAGNYAPNKDNTTKDSLSLGLAFTAVGAKF